MTEKLQCARCGSRRQRNLQVCLDGTALCKRCRNGYDLPDDGSKRYRYADAEQIGLVHDTDDPRYDSKEFTAHKERYRRYERKRNSPAETS